MLDGFGKIDQFDIFGIFLSPIYRLVNYGKIRHIIKSKVLSIFMIWNFINNIYITNYNSYNKC